MQDNFALSEDAKQRRGKLRNPGAVAGSHPKFCSPEIMQPSQNENTDPTVPKTTVTIHDLPKRLFYNFKLLKNVSLQAHEAPFREFASEKSERYSTDSHTQCSQ